ncbi:uncharacterized protein LOC129923808 isoform X1 [Biomphalaria glabrata]|uniref:Uncharacterized protein LOC129923808 isoform X1 n=1 Tax=Biomphalaria glabrata TaxID=6526 RepID=A0A9W2ZBW6_BIOGL|nr:uncharacterized protein LOC129923808 isoform X1 [Biomphalaria glabrata]
MLLSKVIVTALFHFCIHLHLCLPNALREKNGAWNVTFSLTNVYTSNLCRRTHVVPDLDVYLVIVTLNIYPTNLLAFEDVIVLLQDGSEVCAIKVSLECEAGHHPNSKCICVKKAPSAYLLTIKDKFRANQSVHDDLTHRSQLGIWLEVRSTSSLLHNVRKFLPFPNVTLAPNPSVHLKLDGVRTDLDVCSHTFPVESQHSILFCVKGLRRPSIAMRYHSENHEHVGTECFYMMILIPEGHSLLVLSYHDDCGRSGFVQCKIRGAMQPYNETSLLHLLQQIKEPEDEGRSPVQMFEANKTMILSAVGIVVILVSAGCFAAYIVYVENENRKKKSDSTR